MNCGKSGVVHLRALKTHLLCLSSGLHPSEEHLKDNYVTLPHEGCSNLTARPDAPSFPCFWRMHRYDPSRPHISQDSLHTHKRRRTERKWRHRPWIKTQQQTFLWTCLESLRACNYRKVRKMCMQPQVPLITNRKCCNNFSIIWNVMFWPSGPPYWLINLTEENIWMFFRPRLVWNWIWTTLQRRSALSVTALSAMMTKTSKDVINKNYSLTLSQTFFTALNIILNVTKPRKWAHVRHWACSVFRFFVFCFLFFSFCSTTSTSDFTGSWDCFRCK